MPRGNPFFSSAKAPALLPTRYVLSCLEISNIAASVSQLALKTHRTRMRRQQLPDPRQQRPSTPAGSQKRELGNVMKKVGANRSNMPELYLHSNNVKGLCALIKYWMPFLNLPVSIKVQVGRIPTRKKAAARKLQDRSLPTIQHPTKVTP